MEAKPMNATPGTTASKAGAREWIGLAVIALPCLVYAMDLTVLNLAVPQISADLKPSATGLLWIVDIYGFFVASSLITMGTLGDRIGRRRLLMLGAAGFGAASVLAALATSAEMLVAARALLGIAGGTLAPSTLSLITVMFKHPAERTKAIGFWVMSFSLGGAIGPLAGGALLEFFWWGSVFLIGLPAVAILLILGPRLLPEYRDPNAGGIDLASALLSLVAVLASVYGLKQVAIEGFSTTSALAIGLGLALGLGFVRRQGTLDSPLVDLDLFRLPEFSASLVANLLSFFAIFGLAVLEAQYLQSVLDLSPLEAGLWTLPGALGFVVGASLTERFTRWHQSASIVTAGLALGAAGLAVLTQVGGDLAPLVVGATILSLGLGPVVTLAADLVVSAAPPERAGSAAALNETSSELGGALGIAVLGSLLAAVYRATLPAGAPDTARESLGEAVSASEHLVDAAALDGAREAFTQAFEVTAGLGSALLLTAAVITARALRKGTPERANTAARPAPEVAS
jgi:DHA2 family multidrug resistance protein-like MFS transporter